VTYNCWANLIYVTQYGDAMMRRMTMIGTHQKKSAEGVRPGDPMPAVLGGSHQRRKGTESRTRGARHLTSRKHYIQTRSATVYLFCHHEPNTTQQIEKTTNSQNHKYKFFTFLKDDFYYERTFIVFNVMFL